MNVSYPSESLVAAEIARQPALWPDTLNRISCFTGKGNFDGLAVILTGAGSSFLAAQAIAEAWPGARAVPSTDLLLLPRGEIEGTVPLFASRGILISLARSGDSPESTAVVERVKRFFPRVRHLAIVCNEAGTLAQMPGVEAVCLDPRTNDRSLAMTGSFSNLVLAGLCLVHSRQLAAALPQICRDVTAQLEAWNAAAKQLADGCDDRVVVLASSMHALASEASLKILEMTAGRTMTFAESFLGLRHGPLAALREHTPVLCFASTESAKQLYERDLVAELKQRGLGSIALVGNEECSSWAHDALIKSGAWCLPDSLRTPFEVIFAQLLAFHISVHAGVDPDDPSPVGTITRVVKPFQIHEREAEA